jgi:hypothetical protein
MTLLRRRVTSPGIDALLMFLVGWSLMDVGGVMLAAQEAGGWGMAVVSLACFVIALRCFVVALQCRRSTRRD